MRERVWIIPQDQFVAMWRAAGTLAEAAERVKLLAGGAVPRWAVMARAAALRKAGVDLQDLPVLPGPAASPARIR